MKAIDRIKQYIDYKGITNRAFEQKNDLSNGYIATQLKRNADLGEGILNKILENCLDINPLWLITGNGEMFKNIDTITQTTTGNNNISIGKGNNNNVSSSTENNTIKQLQKELEDCKNQLEDYKKMIAEKDNQLNKLLNILAK